MWATSEIGDSEISINRYTLFGRDRDESKRGVGVLLYVNTDIAASLRADIKMNSFESAFGAT